MNNNISNIVIKHGLFKDSNIIPLQVCRGLLHLYKCKRLTIEDIDTLKKVSKGAYWTMCLVSK